MLKEVLSQESVHYDSSSYDQLPDFSDPSQPLLARTVKTYDSHARISCALNGEERELPASTRRLGEIRREFVYQRSLAHLVAFLTNLIADPEHVLSQEGNKQYIVVLTHLDALIGHCYDKKERVLLYTCARDCISQLSTENREKLDGLLERFDLAEGFNGITFDNDEIPDLELERLKHVHIELEKQLQDLALEDFSQLGQIESTRALLKQYIMPQPVNYAELCEDLNAVIKLVSSTGGARSVSTRRIDEILRILNKCQSRRLLTLLRSLGLQQCFLLKNQLTHRQDDYRSLYESVRLVVQETADLESYISSYRKLAIYNGLLDQEYLRLQVAHNALEARHCQPQELQERFERFIPQLSFSPRATLDVKIFFVSLCVASLVLFAVMMWTLYQSQTPENCEQERPHF